MRRLADGLSLLHGLPPYAINVYLMGGVLVDAGTRHAARRILRQVRGRPVSALALTHAHPDHQGSCHAVCETLGVPLWCGAADAEAVEDPGLMLRRLPQNWLTRSIGPLMAGPAHPVARRLRAGDEVGGFTVLETPGHCAGHVSYWRPPTACWSWATSWPTSAPRSGSSASANPRAFLARPGRESPLGARVAALEPALVCFGHGPPLADTRCFVEFIGRLAVD